MGAVARSTAVSRILIAAEIFAAIGFDSSYLYSYPFLRMHNPKGKNMRLFFAVMAAVLLATSPGFAEPDPARAKQCKAALSKAKRMGLLYKVDYTDGKPQAFVDTLQWLNLPFDNKLVFSQVIACDLLQGDIKEKISFEILDHRNLMRLGYYNGSTLQIR